MPQATSLGPQAAASSSSPRQDTVQSAFDASLFYILTAWSPLALAVSNSWAGPLTEDKRDWFVGAISTLFDTHPDTDALDVEEVMLQVMADEFEVEVQDDSAALVAEEIVQVRARIIGEGDLAVAQLVKERWEAKGQGRAAGAGYVNGGENEVETDAEEDDEDEDEDEEMLDAPALVSAKPPKEKVEPEVDDEGFTKVVSRRKR